MGYTESFAYLNWRMRKFDRAANYAAMAEGYELGAVRLLDTLIENNAGHDADAVIFPVLFDAHQAVELYLKAALVAVCEASNQNPWSVEIPVKHNLKNLLNTLNAKIPSAEERIIRKREASSLFVLMDFLECIGSDGEGGYFPDFARYPEKDATKQYLFIESDELIFRLTDIKEVIQNGCQFIGGYCFMWIDRADSIRGMRAEIYSSSVTDSI